ncbi:MAG: hypothetical protein JO211_07325 [Acidobacteriaceae bacterium]|nr:hypothetical protein [Acidobacteriaceae bacterium]
MSRSCSACNHPESFEINEAIIVRGCSKRAVADQFGLSPTAVQRHKRHIPQLLVEASRHTDHFEADAILMRVEDLERETLEALEQAKAQDELGFVLASIREQRHNLELVSKIRQIIQTAPQVNVAISPQVQQVIIEALGPYPDAKLAVADALGQVGEAAGSS